MLYSRGMWLVCLLLLWPGLSYAAEFSIDLQLRDTTLKAPRYRPEFSGQGPFSVIDEGIRRQYYYYQPQRAGPQAPLLLLLHGAGRDGRSMMDTWKTTAQKHGLRLLAPDGVRHNWSMRPSAEWPALKKMVEQHSGGGDTLYVFGHSNGARMALRLAAAFPAEFAAVAVHAGTEPGLDVASYSGARPAIALFLGAQDHIFSVPGGRATVQRFEQAGFKTSLYILQNHTHWYYSDAPRINQSIWAFMKRYP